MSSSSGASGVAEAGVARDQPDGQTSPRLIGGARLLHFRTMNDSRGVLTVGEVGAELPFAPVRFFTVSGVPAGQCRGEHAHHRLEEVVVLVRGACTVSLDDGRDRQDVLLDSPTVGLYIPPMLWRVHHSHSPDAVLLALASTPYEPADYIRDYDEFLSAAGVR